MKITVTPIPAATALVLGEDAAGDYVVRVPLVREQRQAQVEPLFRSDVPFAEARGNKVCSFSWAVSKEHATAAAAAAYALGHGATVPKKAKIEILEGGTTTTFTSALIVGVNVLDVTGRSTVIEYVVEGAKA